MLGGDGRRDPAARRRCPCSWPSLSPCALASPPPRRLGRRAASARSPGARACRAQGQRGGRHPGAERPRRARDGHELTRSLLPEHRFKPLCFSSRVPIFLDEMERAGSRSRASRPSWSRNCAWLLALAPAAPAPGRAARPVRRAELPTPYHVAAPPGDPSRVFVVEAAGHDPPGEVDGVTQAHAVPRHQRRRHGHRRGGLRVRDVLDGVRARLRHQRLFYVFYTRDVDPGEHYLVIEEFRRSAPTRRRRSRHAGGSCS